MIRLVKELGATPGQSSREQDLRNFLGTFNFTGDMVKQNVGSMSGGEKARLVLAMIVWQRPNLLLLDEPTNHLDLATREALSMALNEFEGTVMLVSHDRALLRAVCDEFWLVGRGEIKPFDGDLDDYQRYLLEESKRLREEAKTNEVDAPLVMPATVTAESPKQVTKIANRTPEQKKEDALLRQQKSALQKPLKKSIEQADLKIAKLETDKLALESKLTTPLSPAEIAETGKLLKTVNTALEELEIQWLAWSEELERLKLEA
jgi:ATP-binding cassette subfamily F protein 3